MSEEAAPAPAAEAAPAPAVEAAPAPAIVDAAPAPEAAPAAETPPPAPSSLLSEAAPAEAPPPEAPAEPAAPEAKPTDEAPPAEALPPITYQPFTLPEGVTLSEAEVGRFTETLGKHRASQELGQELMNLYLSEVDRFQANQRDVWERTQNSWRDEVAADPELGGNRIQTVLQECGSVIEQYGSPELRQALALTGAGNHPAVIRFVHKVAKALGEGKPVAAQKSAPAQPPSRSSRRYGANQS